MTMDSDLSNTDESPEEREALELILEAARRANWEALHGPAYLRSGRYFEKGTPAIAGAAQQGVEPDGSAPSPSVSRRSAG
jgi:hypothetical protein